MNDYTMYGGSLCVTDMMDALKKGHSAFSKSPKNGKVYCNIVEFVKQAPDDYGNHASIQMSSTKEKREEEKNAYGKFNYLGNLKKLDSSAPVSERAASNVANDGWDKDVPVRQQESGGTTYSYNPNDITEPQDDLPF